MNNKGFTLIELIATIVLLSLVVGISSYAISGIIKKSREKNYDVLIENIRNAGEVYYQECKYGSNTNITCNDNNRVKLGDLVKYGYLKGNSKKNDNYTLVNPLNNNDIGECQIIISYNNGSLIITSATSNDACPATYQRDSSGSKSNKPDSNLEVHASSSESLMLVRPGDATE